jgi:G3E family GTPase
LHYEYRNPSLFYSLSVMKRLKGFDAIILETTGIADPAPVAALPISPGRLTGNILR